MFVVKQQQKTLCYLLDRQFCFVLMCFFDEWIPILMLLVASFESMRVYVDLSYASSF